MIAAHQRTLRPGTEYNRYFPLAGLERTDPIVADGDTFTTIDQMEKVIRQYQADTAGVAPLLKGHTLEATCRNIWEWCYRHFQYKMDEAGVEQLRRPLRAWRDRKAGIDCDCYSILISTLLLNLGIAHKLRKTKYNGGKDYQHIYVVVPIPGTARYYTIDPVVDKFNYEVPFSAKFDRTMQIQVLNGVPGSGAATGAIPAPILAAHRGRYRHLGFGAEFVGLRHTALSGLAGLGDVAYDPQEVAAVASTMRVSTADATAFMRGVDETAASFLERLRQHLQNTVSIIRASRETSLYGQATQLERVLRVWDDAPARDAAIAAAAAAENAGLSGLGGLFDAIGSAVGQATGWVKDKVTTAAQAVGTGVSNAVHFVGDKLADSAQLVNKYQPLTVLVRNALLLAFKINLFRMAERLGYGYFSEQQADSAGLDMGEFLKCRDTLNKLKSVWLALGGNTNDLQSHIMDGYHHGTTKFGTPRLGEPTTAAAGTAAATPVIVKIIDWLNKVDWDKLFKAAASAKSLVASKSTNKDFNDIKVNPNYVAPLTEESYLSNKTAYDNGTPSSGNGLLWVGLAAAVGGYFILTD